MTFNTILAIFRLRTVLAERDAQHNVTVGWLEGDDKLRLFSTLDRRSGTLRKVVVKVHEVLCGFVWFGDLLD